MNRDPVDALVLDLLDWIGPAGRPYAEVLDAWRTSCPRLPVWEECQGRGYVEFVHRPGSAQVVCLSLRGIERLAEHRSSLHARFRGNAIAPA